MVWLEVIGWVGSGLVVLSLMQARVWRFRLMNLAGSVVATGYNLVLEIWPFVAMNAAIVVINLYWIARLQRERHDAATYEVVEVGSDDAYLRHVLGVQRTDIAATHPGFDAAVIDVADRSAFLVQRGTETVGVVVVRDAGQGVGAVELDYVTPRFRDFTPGEFVYRRSGVFQAKGFRTLEIADDVPASRDYYARVGFRQVDGRWQRPVEDAAAAA